MSKNDKARRVAPKSEPSKIKTKHLTVIIVSAVLAVAVLTLSIIGIVIAARQNRTFNYLKDDISKYILLSREDYTTYEAYKRVVPVNDLAVENELLKLVALNRSEKPDNDGAYILDKAISSGDTVCVYYRGYYIDKDGKEKNIVGENNFTKDSYTEVTIGSGDMPLGFELGLIGLIPKECASFSRTSSGTVAEGDVVYIDYKCLTSDGLTTSYAGSRVVLGEKADAEFGEGFSSFLVGSTIGEGISDTFTTTVAGDINETVYYDVNIKFVTRCENDPIVIEAYLPNDHSEAELRGSKVYYDVYPEKLISYETPEFNDDFILNKLKVTEDELSEFAGTSVVEKYISYIESELTREYEKALTASIEEQMWEHYKSKVTVKSLPDSELKKFYDSYYTEVTRQYSYYQDSFETLDEFARAYLELGTNDNWREYLREFARSTVTQKLIFYYVIRQEGLVPGEDEYNRLYDEIYNECLEAYLEDIDFDRADYKTDEEYEKALEENKKVVLDYYGEAYLRESVYYKFSIDALTDFATLK